MDPRIRIRTQISWIRNALLTEVCSGGRDADPDGQGPAPAAQQSHQGERRLWPPQAFLRYTVVRTR